MGFERAGAARFALFCAFVGTIGCGAGGGRPAQAGEQESQGGFVRPVTGERGGSPIVLGRFGKKSIAYVANADDSTLHTLDVDARRELAVTELRSAPALVFLTRDGRLLVSFRERSRLGVFAVGEPNRPLEP